MIPKNCRCMNPEDLMTKEDIRFQRHISTHIGQQTLAPNDDLDDVFDGTPEEPKYGSATRRILSHSGGPVRGGGVIILGTGNIVTATDYHTRPTFSEFDIIKGEYRRSGE